MKIHIPLWLARTLSFILIGLIIMAGFLQAPHKAAGVPQGRAPQIVIYNQNLTIGTTTLHAAIAASPESQAQGLSNTLQILPDQGMLFVFDSPLVPRFWMKDMRYPLDMIWIDEHKHVVDVTNDVTPDSYPQTYAPKSPVQYVLEVEAGFALKHGIVEGTTVSF